MDITSVVYFYWSLVFNWIAYYANELKMHAHTILYAPAADCIQPPFPWENKWVSAPLT
jgi:hypothetical protein